MCVRVDHQTQPGGRTALCSRRLGLNATSLSSSGLVKVLQTDLGAADPQGLRSRPPASAIMSATLIRFESKYCCYLAGESPQQRVSSC